mgnify:FL=1
MAVLKLTDLEPREQMPGFQGRFLHTDRVTVVHWEVQEGVQLPEHSHPHEQFSILITGTFDMVIDVIETRLSAGAVAIIPPNAVHSGHAVTSCYFIDVFQPVREDYR